MSDVRAVGVYGWVGGQKDDGIRMAMIRMVGKVGLGYVL